MQAIPTLFKEVFLIKSKIHKDERGSFSEQYQRFDFNKVIGDKIDFCQNNFAHSKKGVLRGLHYQLPPFSQTKLVRVIQGSVLDVIVDIRKGSPTFGQHFSCELSHENKLQLFVPRGFAHGFITLEDDTRFQYKCTNYYSKENEGGILFNDKDLNINWGQLSGIPENEFKLSEKDTQLSKMKNFNSPFQYK